MSLIAFLLPAGFSSMRSKAADNHASPSAQSRALRSGTNEDFITALGLMEIPVGPLRVFYGSPLADNLEAVGDAFGPLARLMEAQQKQTAELRRKSVEIYR